MTKSIAFDYLRFDAANTKNQRHSGIMSTEHSEYFRLDAVQGNSEAQTELYTEVLRRSTGAVDEVMRQEFWQSLVLCTKAGQNGGGV